MVAPAYHRHLSLTSIHQRPRIRVLRLSPVRSSTKLTDRLTTARCGPMLPTKRLLTKRCVGRWTSDHALSAPWNTAWSVSGGRYLTRRDGDLHGGGCGERWERRERHRWYTGYQAPMAARVRSPAAAAQSTESPARRQ